MKRPTFARLSAAFRRRRPELGPEPTPRGGGAVPAQRSGKATPPSRRGLPGRDPAPSWHELVQPGPKGDPARKAERLVRAAGRPGEFEPVKSKPVKNKRHRDQPAGELPRLELRAVRRAQFRTLGIRVGGRVVQHQHTPARTAGRVLASPNSRRGRAQRTQSPAAPAPASVFGSADLPGPAQQVPTPK